MTKKELRKYFMEIRKAASCRESDALIFQRLKELDIFDNADTVLIFASHRSEPSTWEFAQYLLDKGISIAYPKCGDDGVMTFFKVKTLDKLHIGKYGIPEPEGSIMDIPQITDKTVCIVPGLAFTVDGRRIGYGGGYYDRFLSKYPSIMTIAPIYEKCIAEDIPTLEHDIKVKAIVTEERMVICNE
ncbi:MAG: 5-formyltetrahydrofolate cyclo-ligase [Ruminococcus sp.]|nr:5-formyltetrahydrofolate cyclo-ligase [Ruminococcus sp.]